MKRSANLLSGLASVVGCSIKYPPLTRWVCPGDLTHRSLEVALKIAADAASLHAYQKQKRHD